MPLDTSYSVWVSIEKPRTFRVPFDARGGSRAAVLEALRQVRLRVRVYQVGTVLELNRGESDCHPTDLLASPSSSSSWFLQPAAPSEPPREGDPPAPPEPEDRVLRLYRRRLAHDGSDCSLRLDGGVLRDTDRELCRLGEMRRAMDQEGADRG